MGHRESEAMRGIKSTPEGEALGNRIIRKVIIGSIATFVVVGIMLAIYFAM